MKLQRILCVLTAACVLGSAARAEPPKAARGPSILIDAATGEVLQADRAGEVWYPASLSKLMTAYVVFQKIHDGKLTLAQKIPVSPRANAQHPSKIGTPVGSTVTVDFAVQALLVYSANDMAVVLAEAAAGSVPAFAAEMNAAARKLGMSATHFVNPNGLFDPRQFTTARDLSVLAGVMLKQFPQHAAYFAQPYLAIGKRRFSNHNSLLRAMPEADGMKTGFVCNSGFNLVASATRNGRKLIAVVLGSKSGFARTQWAKDMLEDGLRASPNPAALTVARLTNAPAMAPGPIDMTPTVCRRKDPVLFVDYETAGGWSAGFTARPTAQQADADLRTRLLQREGLDAPGIGAVVPLPDKTYMPLIHGLDEMQSAALCKAYATAAVPCLANAPQFIASLAVASKQSRAAARVEGSEQPSIRPKKRLRHKRR